MNGRNWVGGMKRNSHRMYISFASSQTYIFSLKQTNKQTYQNPKISGKDNPAITYSCIHSRQTQCIYGYIHVNIHAYTCTYTILLYERGAGKAERKWAAYYRIPADLLGHGAHCKNSCRFIETPRIFRHICRKVAWSGLRVCLMGRIAAMGGLTNP